MSNCKRIPRRIVYFVALFMIMGFSFLAPRVPTVNAYVVESTSADLGLTPVRLNETITPVSPALETVSPTETDSANPEAENREIDPSAIQLLVSPISVLSEGNIYFLKVDLQDPRVRVRVGLANNDTGGYETLASMKNRYANQGYAEWAVMNGDYFSLTGCPSNVNCAQGLTYIDGNRKENWSAYGTTWPVRGNVGFDASKWVQMAIGDAQSKRNMTIAGGPIIVKDGGSATCHGDYINGTTYFSTGEQFTGDQRGYCTASTNISMLGYSSDGRYLYMGLSSSGMTVVELGQWLRDRGASNVIKMDGGGSGGIYYNNVLQKGANTRAIVNHIAVIVENAPPPSSWQAKYAEGDSCWWDTNCGQFNGSAVPKCEASITGPELHKDWGSSAPCGGMSGDHWVGNFTSTINFPSGNYVFHLEHDDGAKLWINGQNRGEFGSSGNNTICNGTGGFSLSGNQSLRTMIREEGGDAKIHLTWDTNTSVCTPPSPPSNLSAAAVSQTQINLTWQDNSWDESNFRVERSLDGVSGWNEIATRPSNTTSYSDTGLTPNTRYYYRVRAYRSTGDKLSDFSNIANAITNASSFNLTVNRSGTGSGTVTSNPIGISCGSDCSETYAYNTSVTLTAAPASGSTFAGWSGDCSGTGSCVLSMTAARSVTASFNANPNSYTLTVGVTGAGSGTVTSSPAGISCPGDCSEAYIPSTPVTLTANPANGSMVTGWSGACTGTGSCILSMTAARSVTAGFGLTAPPSGYFDDFSTYTPGGTPAGWIVRGTDGITPVIEETGGTGSAYRLVSFPEVPWQYWDKWLLKSGLTLSGNYVVTVKLNFQNSVADRAGLTIAWDDTNWNRIDIQPNVYGDNIEFRVNYTGPIPSNINVTNNGYLPINASTDYWLKVEALDNGPGQGQVKVYWSTNGVNYTQVITATGLATVSGLAGISTAGPHMPHTHFDDFSVTSLDIYEPDNTSGQAKWIYSGTPQTHSIVPATDVDWMKFTVSALSTVTLQTSGTTGDDTRMWLYNSSLEEVEYDDDDGAGLYSHINRVCGVDELAAGTYYVKVDEYGNDHEIPAYTISLSVQPCAKDTVGVFRPSNGVIFLKNSNTSGFADIALNYGLAGDYPVTGDWDGDGDDTIGVYRNGRFLLRNSNTVGFAEINFLFGSPGDQPIAGDWNGDGIDTIGVYRRSTGQFLLRNSNTAGPADITFYLGNVGDIAIAGDWNGDGVDTTGVFRPSNGVIFLKNINATGFADVALNYGLAGDKAVVGDWDNDGDTTIGVFRQGRFLLRNSNTNGFADIVFELGFATDMPIAGNWDGLP